MKDGIIIKGISGFYYVEVGQDLYECKARGIFRKKGLSPLVGDRVAISIIDEADKKGNIEKIYERKSELVRPPIANVDKVLITFSVKEPNPNMVLLDRFIVFSEKENLDIRIILTKVDLDEDGTIIDRIVSDYGRIGYKVIPVSVDTGQGIDQVRQELEGCISVFAGQSGVGKSSILNAIEPGFKIDTAEISQKLGRGKHTTRHSELYKLGPNAIVADTPGFSSFELTDIEIEELQEYFIEFAKFDGCRFGSKCIHKNEPACAVKEALEVGEIAESRYKSYLQILDEINNLKIRELRRNL
ncbi:ribosome small subunit-dependent GTPase A [Peptostreptococcus stomatis]|uniref:ribosome small subunit-dependent GTPase A n=1 Tax=Peptostreptococcus stomatis TaxID=341694 RepID=UPI0024A8F1C6|nr:ribosome small subunit-dependent GTPase A [Peptostreptococcus stomatis]